MQCEIAKLGCSVTPQTDLSRQCHIFSYTQCHYTPQALGRPLCLEQSDRVKSFPCAALGQLVGES